MLSSADIEISYNSWELTWETPFAASCSFILFFESAEIDRVAFSITSGIVSKVDSKGLGLTKRAKSFGHGVLSSQANADIIGKAT